MVILFLVLAFIILTSNETIYFLCIHNKKDLNKIHIYIIVYKIVADKSLKKCHTINNLFC